MRFPRVLGAALLILVALAACEVAPAMARKVVLCSANEAFCKKANVASGTFTSAAPAVLDFGAAGSIECASSLTQAEFVSSSIGVGSISALSFGECSEGCAVQANGLPYQGLYESVSGGEADLRIVKPSGEVALAVKCKTAECVYTAAKIDARFEGGEPGFVGVGGSLVEKEESFFCPPTMTWEAFYEITSPSSLFAAFRGVEGPAFCKTNVEKCPQEAIVTEVAAETFVPQMSIGTFVGGGTIGCAEGFFLIQDEELEATGPWRYKPASFSKCTSATYTACEVKFKKDPYKAQLIPLGGGEGLIGVSQGPGGGKPQLQVSCTYLKTPYTCLYETPEFFLGFQAGAPPFLVESGKYEKVEGSASFCSTKVTLSAKYISTTLGGKALYLTEAES